MDHVFLNGEMKLVASPNLYLQTNYPKNRAQIHPAFFMPATCLCSVINILVLQRHVLLRRKETVSSVDTVKLHPKAQMVRHSSGGFFFFIILFFLHSAFLWYAEGGGGGAITHGQDP